MKKSHLPIAPWFWGVFLGISLQVSAQTTFWAGANAAFPLGDLPERNASKTALDARAFSPAVFEQLMEKLEGEFFIGNPGSEQNQIFTLTGQQKIAPGLWLGLGLGRRFEVRAGASWFRREWSGQFPVTVFPFQGTETRQVSGGLQAEATGVFAETDLAFFFGDGRYRPYLHGGLRGVFTGSYTPAADLAGVELSLPDQAAETDFAPSVGGGIRAGFARKGFADLSVSYGKVPGGEYAPAIKLGVGWYFGTPQNELDKPELISVNTNNCDCKGANTKFSAKTTTKLGRDRPGNPPVEQNFEFDTRDNQKSKHTATQRVQTVDSISLEISGVEVACQPCKLGDCPPSIVEVTVRTVGLQRFLKKDKDGKQEKNTDGSNQTTDKIALKSIETRGEGGTVMKKYVMDMTSVATSPSGDVRLEISVRYKCGKNLPPDGECKQSTETCSNDFVIIFNRDGN
jgi:hypothetical protein